MEGRNIHDLIRARATAIRFMQKEIQLRDPLVITVALGRRAGHTLAGQLLLEEEPEALMLVHTQDMKRLMPPNHRVLTHGEARELRGVRASMVILDDYSWIKNKQEYERILAPFHSQVGFVEVRLG